MSADKATSPPEPQNTESDSIPLQHQRFFGGAGLKRKRVVFVPASDPDRPVGDQKLRQPLGDLYLSIVRPPSIFCWTKNGATEKNTSVRKANGVRAQETSIHEHESPPSPAFSPSSPSSQNSAQPSDTRSSLALCPVCNVPLPDPTFVAPTHEIPHELSLTHQIALSHSHPPSALDRHSKGLAYLSSYGWDPDARLGLGAAREGRLDFVRASRRGAGDVRGIGVEWRDDDDVGDEKKRRAESRMRREKERHIKRETESAKTRERRKRQEEERMRALVYGRHDVNKMLGIEL